MKVSEGVMQYRIATNKTIGMLCMKQLLRFVFSGFEIEFSANKCYPMFQLLEFDNFSKMK